MSTVEGKKQEKRRALLDAAYELFLERGTSKTSVEDITSRAKVGKGTFYLYFADKGSVTQALLARVSYQLLDNACAAAEQHAAELAELKHVAQAAAVERDQVRDELATVKAKAEAADQAHQEQRKTAAQEAHRVAERLTKAQGERDQARTDAAATREELAKIRGQLEASEAYKAELLGMLNKGTQAQAKTVSAAKKGQ